MLGPGARVDDYEVVGLIAIGPLCDVYEAVTVRDGRKVALKLLHEVWSSNPDVVARFSSEARILESIRHPHIVALIDSGFADGHRPFMVLEWLPRNLARALADASTAVSAPTTATITLQIAHALSALHDRGIVHRDIKPANVLLDGEELATAHVRLADLGLAKVSRDEPPGSYLLGHVAREDGALLGTWDYMAPEQWLKSTSVDEKADIYSLGVLLFQMLAGHLPFVAEHAKDLMALHLFEVPPIEHLEGNAPHPLRNLVARMLGKLPAMRPTMREVIVQLSTI